jgi:hypothetical protein
MSTISRYVVKTERVELHVPAPEPIGACWVEVYKAVRMAHQELVDLGELDEGADAADDQIMISAGVNTIIVNYERRSEVGA